ncbi:MAG: 4-hydroxythreonine-4-phosphate dehydrogenase PdxA [Ramlibacter sp.]|nr:4-hydroxythreonine-4-phosphate dehydrogenase PdxA [Ramlibacter sp.]
MNASVAGRPFAITMGDPAGIGPEIVAKAFALQPELTRGCFVVGDIGCMRRGAAIAAAGQPPLAIARIGAAAEVAGVPPRCIPVLSPGEPQPDLPPLGAVSAQAGRLAAQAVLWAARAALRGELAGIVTAPLHKEALAAAGLPYPGHTELLQAEAAVHTGVPLAQMPVRMMLANEDLRTVLVSIHLSLRQAIDAVTFEQVLQTLHITDTALTAMLGKRPRIAVAGLNPHAGEGGLFGREEIEAIAPAVQAAQAAGLAVQGPFAPDTVFMRARRGEFDVVVAMYHDQGLIPVKYLGVEQGVNVTLGLPLVRTSPDHGTAFDIAGTGRADPSSLLAALRMARRLAPASV